MSFSSRSSNSAAALLQTTPCSSSCALFMELAWGASGECDPPLAMQSAPPRWRGVLSGIVQSGYSIGYLLAAVAARLILPVWGWRAMFWVGGIPALLALYIRSKVKESEAWKRHHAPTVAAIFQTVRDHRKLFGYLVCRLLLEKKKEITIRDIVIEKKEWLNYREKQKW